MEKENTKSKPDASLEAKVKDLIAQVEQVIKTTPIVNPEELRKLIEALNEQVPDVVAIEENMDSIRREITDPVKAELEKSSKLGKFSKWGFVVGIIGSIFAIGSIGFSVYVNFENKKLISKLETANQKLLSNMQDLREEYQKAMDSNSSTLQSSDTLQLPLNSGAAVPDLSGVFEEMLKDSLDVKIKVGAFYYHIPSGNEIMLKSINADGSVNLAIETNSILGSNPNSGLNDFISPDKQSSVNYYDNVNIGFVTFFSGNFMDNLGIIRYQTYQLSIKGIDRENDQVRIALIRF